MSYLFVTEPPHGSLWQFSAIIDGAANAHMGPSFKDEAVRHYKRKGALDLLCAAVDKFTTEKYDDNLRGTLIRMDAVVLSRQEYEDCIRRAYMAGMSNRP